jgi:hypothetical protein
MSADFGRIISALVKAEVEFILVGGLAGVVHGAARITYDVDIVYSRSTTSIAKLARGLEGFAPYLRGAPPGLPFRWDERTIRNGLNFTLTTTIGDLDLLGEAAGGGNYEALLPNSVVVNGYGVRFRCVDLPTLIRLKRAAGRPKDLEAISELELLLSEGGEAE